MSIASEHLLPRMAGFNVIDCEVKDKDTLYLLGREDYTQRNGWGELQEAPPERRLPKRIFVVRLGNPDDKKWGHMHLTGMDTSKCAMCFAPEEKLVVVDADAKVWVQNPKTNGFEAGIAYKVDGGMLVGDMNRAKSFGGELLLGGTQRQLFRRNGPSDWALIGPPIEVSEAEFRDCGFHDFDQFSDSDLYAAGGSGDVWHFNGTKWRQCKFPTDWGVSALKCAPDGHVYIAAGNLIYRGSGDRWQKLQSKASITLPLRDLVWYEGTLWTTNDYGVWTLKDEALVEADLPSGVKVCSGNLATRDGVLLLAGHGGASFKRDGQWTEIFHDHEVREWLETNRDKVWTPPN